MAVPGRLPSRTVEDGVLEALGGLAATGAGGWAFIVPGRVGAEVTFPRPHRVEAACVELGEAHK